MTKRNNFLFLICFCASVLCCLKADKANAQTNPWPQLKKEMHPWTRWWWMGSAVDEKNLDVVLTKYSKAGFGGVEITPIYGAIGFENRYINFLSPQWMSMLNFTVSKASSLGMGVDMNTGTGWPFGGPQVTTQDAASRLIVQTYKLEAGKNLAEKIILKDERQIQAGAQLQAVTAYGNNGEVISLLDKVDNAGKLSWQPASGSYEIYAAFCGKTLQMVKRAAAGGEGLVMNHLNKKAVDDYLGRFDTAFDHKAPGIRAFFNDSYEVYNANFSPDLFDEFKKRRGYDLRLYLRELQSNEASENVERIKSDYRETVSQMLLDNMAVNWTNWAHKYNRITKYQAHGSPGNLLDLYAAADIPECEAYFGLSYFPVPGLRHDTTDVVNPNSNPNVFKFATSAAHLYNKPLASSETFVWQTDHFKTSFSQCKPEVERLFLAGINHVFYHGTTYSPEDVPFPGWQFYASTNFTPSNSLWPQLSGLNNYIARCQSVLQAGKPDNDLLLYWPVYDTWANPKGTDLQISMHNTNEWLNQTAFNKLATNLQQVGYSVDFISDKMIAQSHAASGNIQTNAGASVYKVLLVPSCKYMPVETLKKIIQLAKDGATVVMEALPADVNGMNDLDNGRRTFKNLLAGLSFTNANNNIKEYKTGKGRILLSGNIAATMQFIKQDREGLTDIGLQFIRRSLNDGKYYYLVNHTAKIIDQYIPIDTKAAAVDILDPQSGDYGRAAISAKSEGTNVRIQMQPGEALILRTFSNNTQSIKTWKYIEKTGEPVTLSNEWNLHFTEGGPDLPADQKLSNLISWTNLPDTKGIAFSGTGEYTTTFNLPAKNAKEYLLDLGKIDESAHVWINGQDAGILWSIPFKARVGKYLKQGSNTIKIEVVNLMANRIRDMDIKGIKWRNYHEINFVNINYKPFDASKWEPQPSGLLGPVTITPLD